MPVALGPPRIRQRGIRRTMGVAQARPASGGRPARWRKALGQGSLTRPRRRAALPAAVTREAPPEWAALRARAAARGAVQGMEATTTRTQAAVRLVLAL